MKKVQIAFVRGNEGYSLQIYGKTSGYRYAGPKAWGNPYNKPTAEFTVDVEDFIKCLQHLAYEEDLKEGDNNEK